jgi:hypothetical protein
LLVQKAFDRPFERVDRSVTQGEKAGAAIVEATPDVVSATPIASDPPKTEYLKVSQH